MPDSSHRKEAAARGRHCEAIVNSSGEAILSEGLDGTIESWNPAAERLYGYSAKEMIGASVALLRPNSNLDDAIRERRLVCLDLALTIAPPAGGGAETSD